MSGRAQYLLAVYIESERGEPPVSSGTIAQLNKSVSAVTETLQRPDG